jgi:hypothetical protein
MAVPPSAEPGNTRVLLYRPVFRRRSRFLRQRRGGRRSTCLSQIVALSPPAFGADHQLNQTVTIRVHEVNSGTDATWRRLPYAGSQISLWETTISPLTDRFRRSPSTGRGLKRRWSRLAVRREFIRSATEIRASPRHGDWLYRRHRSMTVKNIVRATRERSSSLRVKSQPHYQSVSTPSR